MFLLVVATTAAHTKSEARCGMATLKRHRQLSACRMPSTPQSRRLSRSSDGKRTRIWSRLTRNSTLRLLCVLFSRFSSDYLWPFCEFPLYLFTGIFTLSLSICVWAELYHWKIQNFICNELCWFIRLFINFPFYLCTQSIFYIDISFG